MCNTSDIEFCSKFYKEVLIGTNAGTWPTGTGHLGTILARGEAAGITQEGGMAQVYVVCVLVDLVSEEWGGVQRYTNGDSGTGI